MRVGIERRTFVSSESCQDAIVRVSLERCVGGEVDDVRCWCEMAMCGRLECFDGMDGWDMESLKELRSFPELDAWPWLPQARFSKK